MHILFCCKALPVCLTTQGMTCTCRGAPLRAEAFLLADRLSPFKFYQYLLTNVGDVEVIKFLRMLTFVPLAELETLEQSMREPGYRPNTAQRMLAAEVTRFVHGQQGLDQALKATEVHMPSHQAALHTHETLACRVLSV